MAHLGKAWVFAFARDPALSGPLDSLLGTVATLAMNDREQGHLAALKQASASALSASVAILDRHLMRYPFDILAHQIAVFLDQFQGRVRWMRDRTARALPLWSKDLPGYDALLTYPRFWSRGNRRLCAGRRRVRARRSNSSRPTSFAHHTVAHVMEMTGRPEDGLGWMVAREPFWTREDHFLQNHIWWHRALFHLELGQYDEALALYDGPLVASQKPMARSLTNQLGVAVASRCMLGYDVADRWRVLGDACGRGMPTAGASVFHDMHAAMAELGSGQEVLVERRLAAMRTDRGERR